MGPCPRCRLPQPSPVLRTPRQPESPRLWSGPAHRRLCTTAGLRKPHSVRVPNLREGGRRPSGHGSPAQRRPKTSAIRLHVEPSWPPPVRGRMGVPAWPVAKNNVRGTTSTASPRPECMAVEIFSDPFHGFRDVVTTTSAWAWPPIPVMVGVLRTPNERLRNRLSNPGRRRESCSSIAEGRPRA